MWDGDDDFCLGVHFKKTSDDGDGSICKGLNRVQITAVEVDPKDRPYTDGLFPHPSDADDVSYAKDGTVKV